MSIHPLLIALPLIFAILQLEATDTLTGHWKRAAFLPVAFVLAGFVAQYALGAISPENAALGPISGLAAGAVYLAGLLAAHRRFGVEYELVELALVADDNVLWLDAYRQDTDARQQTVT